MLDHSKCAFHLARADAERVAAAKATSALTVALHRQLADLHTGYARTFAAKQGPPMVVASRRPEARSDPAPDHARTEPAIQVRLVG